MWSSMMTLPDGAEVEVSPLCDAADLPGPTYRVSRRGVTIGEFSKLHDIALFVRYRHDQATHDALIKADVACLGASRRSGLFGAAPAQPSTGRGLLD